MNGDPPAAWNVSKRWIEASWPCMLMGVLSSMDLISAWFSDSLISFGAASPSAIGSLIRIEGGKKIPRRRIIYRLTPHKMNSGGVIWTKKKRKRKREVVQQVATGVCRSLEHPQRLPLGG